ncbi:MAG TPA: HK97 gp10 family phage protein [Candidatus Mediterraneibacter ornithocaccae]|nr:HK97 gp10 family phage protein [Candidatus Mediterraneibacter ornithocaccae]
MGMEFIDNSELVKRMLEEATISGVLEAAAECEAQTIRNTRVDTGQTKESWKIEVEDGGHTAVIGNPLENSLWEEFGTGEYALKGNGRKGGWYIPEERLSSSARGKMKKVVGKNGKVYYFTKGKRPTRAFQNAFATKKKTMIKLIINSIKKAFS